MPLHAFFGLGRRYRFIDVGRQIGNVNRPQLQAVSLVEAHVVLRQGEKVITAILFDSQYQRLDVKALADDG